MRRIVFTVLVMIFLPTCCMAITIPYSVSGSILFEDLDTYEEYEHGLSGVFNINPVPEYTFGNSGEPNEIISATYYIENFSIEVDNFSFFGSGTMYMTPEDFYIFLDGSGDYESMVFDDEIDCSKFNFNLEEEIFMSAFVLDIDNRQPLTGTNTVIWDVNLNLSAAPPVPTAPIPEPSTIILFLFGLTGVVAHRKKSTPNRKCQS